MKSIQVKWLLTAIIGILLFVSTTLYYRLDKLNNTIHNLYLSNSSNDIKQINSLIFESHFKDDLVLSSFNTSTTIIITFFTVIIALGGYLSFNKINEEIKDLKTLKQEVEEAQSKIKTTTIEVKEAKSKIETTAIDVEEAKIHVQITAFKTENLHNYVLEEKAEDFFSKIFNTITALNIYTAEKKDIPIDVHFFFNGINTTLTTLTLFKQFLDYNKEKLPEDKYKFINKKFKVSTNLISRELNKTLKFCQEGEVSFTGGKANFILNLLNAFTDGNYYKEALLIKEINIPFQEILNILETYKNNYNGNISN